jgi:hypothetical protein
MEQATTDSAVEHACLTSCENAVAQKKKKKKKKDEKKKTALEQPCMQAHCNHFSATRHTQWR